jgi:hypothetical protein
MMEAPQPVRPTGRLTPHALPAWAVSLLFHASLLLLLLFVLGGGRGDLEDDAEVADNYVIQLTPQGDSSPTQPLHAPAAPTGTAPSNGDGAPAPNPGPATFDEVFKQQLPPLIAAPPQISLPGPLEADVLRAPTLPKPPLPSAPTNLVETEFFGQAAKGTKFVYVIDRSASMQFALATAKAELLASLARLPPTAEFQVILYDLEPRLIDVGGSTVLLPASRENKTRVARTLDGIRSEGGTDHVKALKRALALSPHVIYFLTDADELRPGQVQELTQLNRRGGNARIHCIELSVANVDRSGTPMRILAQENRGEYRGIDPTRVKR